MGAVAPTVVPRRSSRAAGCTGRWRRHRTGPCSRTVPVLLPCQRPVRIAYWCFNYKLLYVGGRTSGCLGEAALVVVRGIAALFGVLVLLGCSAATASAARMGSPSIAALQVALRADGLYSGTIDGFAGPGTNSGVRSLQRRRGLIVDGIAGPQTLRALGRRGRPRLGARALSPGATGFDVAALQFLL